MGKPSKLTDETEAKLLGLIRQGVPIATAAVHAGISEATYYRWRDRGRKAKSGRYRRFVDRLQEAQGVAEATLVLQMRTHAKTAGNTGYQATAWMLERRFPERWAKHQVIENRHQAHDGGAMPEARLTIDLATATPEQLAALTGVDLGGDDDELQADPDPGAPPEES